MLKFFIESRGVLYINKKSILIIVIVGIIVIIGIVLCDLFIPREKRLDEVDYNYSKPIKAYNVKEENNDIILTWYLVDPFRRVLYYKSSDDDILEKPIVTDYFENKFTAIFNYIYNYKEKYKGHVKLKGNAIIYTDNAIPTSDFTKQRFYDEYINSFLKDIPKINL